jgi:glycosyltransferase involved in cell wall biosynthesis
MSYVLITPARNEEAFIGETLAAVGRQAVRPAEWIIVSDGSTDGTDRLVLEASAKWPWIRLVPLAPRDGHCFAAVVRATETGLAALKTTDYQYIGLLDADVRFESDYFARVLAAFEDSPTLGLAGGVVLDVGRPRHERPRNQIDVPGAVQFFRRGCFESLGGLFAIPEGGWDALTCARARQLGYDTRLLTDLIVEHLKPRNAAKGGVFRRNWQLGVRDRALGYHPLFEIIKCISRWDEPPFFVAAATRGLGFAAAGLSRMPRHIPDDLRSFVQREQLSRLRQLLRLPKKSHSVVPQSRSTTGKSALS